MIYVAIALGIAALGVFSIAYQTRQGARQVQLLTVALETFASQLSEGGAGTDPALIERIEAAERRVEAIAADATKQYRKTAQERRRIEAATGIDDDDDSDTPAALDQLRLAVGQPGPPNGRRRLRRRTRR